MISSGRMIRYESLFVEDRAPCHTDKDNGKLLLNGSKKPSWPSKSPYMNPIEHLLTIFERIIRKIESEDIFKS